jgi:hypothetical protein
MTLIHVVNQLTITVTTVYKNNVMQSSNSVTNLLLHLWQSEWYESVVDGTVDNESDMREA